MIFVDLNCDVGEGMGSDAELMPFITSANIACGGHAGDVASMRATVSLAQAHGVGMGAHPGYEDWANFGRRELEMPAAALRELMIRQISALGELAPVRHVKPHGALYNRAARERAVADLVVEAIVAVDPSLILFALAGSELARAGRARGLSVAEEVFADRSYRADGSLTPRTESNALIDDERVVLARAVQMIEHGTVRATDGSLLKISADTLCLHGDGANAASLARGLRHGLTRAGITLRAFVPA